MSTLFNLIYACTAIVMLPVWIARGLRSGWHTFHGWFDRLRGATPSVDKYVPVVWMHGASVGETLALKSLIAEITHRELPAQIVLSSYTTDGLSVAKRRFPEALSFYLPFDFSFSVRRALRKLKPRLLILSELDLWPNLLMEAKRQDVPVVVVSSRMNDEDYAFFLKINRLHRCALSAVRWWGAQTAGDAERIQRLLPSTTDAREAEGRPMRTDVRSGPQNTLVEVTGSLKLDAGRAITADDIPQLRQEMGFGDSESLLVAGSTHAPEEELLMDALVTLRQDHPLLRLVLVPRDVDRSPQVQVLAWRRGLSCGLQSQGNTRDNRSPLVTIVDSVGKLTQIWALASIAFTGGSLCSGRGGQSMIEPALQCCPIFFGPNVSNFQSLAEGLLQANGACQVSSGADLTVVISRWLRNPAEARQTGMNAQNYVQSQQGATAKTLAAISEWL